MEQNQFEVLKKDMGAWGHKIDKMYYALVGNELTGGGLIQQVADLKADKIEFGKRLDKVEQNVLKSGWRVNLIWGFGGTTFGTLVIFILEHLLTKK